MEPGSPANSVERSPHTLATVIGAVIAFLTLAAPIVSIAQFSSTKTDRLLQSPAQLLLPDASTRQD